MINEIKETDKAKIAKILSPDFLKIEELKWTNPNELEFLLNAKDDYSQFLSKLFARNPTPRVILDIGANNGLFSLQIAQSIKDYPCSIYAFEPFEQPYDCLLSNSQKANEKLGLKSENNKLCSIIPVKAAVSNESGVLEGVYLPNYSLLSGFHVSQEDKEMLEEISGKNLDQAFKPSVEKVESVRLDNWLKDKQINKIDLIKIDVEKAELDVLKSLGDYLSQGTSAIIAEVHEINKEDFMQMLKSAGFEDVTISEPTLPIFCLTEKGKLQHSLSSGWNSKLNTYIVWAFK
jgi:FkbM family methyltransferase